MAFGRQGKPFTADYLGLPCFPRVDLIEQTPVSSPRIASERYLEPLKEGPAAGSPTGGSLRGH